jgi:deoxycytidylate deaminase
MEWKDHFIAIAHAIATKSKDPMSKVGCVIVDEDQRIVSTGYNGFIKGCDESKLSWERPAKYQYVVHAEANALLFAHRNLKNATMYLTDAPCDNCLKHLLQAGIRKVYYSKADIMVQRGTDLQKDTVKKLIECTGAEVLNANTGESITEELEKSTKNE